MKLNFKEENIPDIKQLLKNIEKDYKKYLKNKKYEFCNIFKINEKGKYFVDKSFKENMNLNSKLGKNIKNNNELSGIYIFYNEDNIAVYVGISRTIFRRIRQHFLSESKTQSSLVALMAKKKYDDENKQKKKKPIYKFNNYNKIIQKEMKEKWKIQFIPEDNNYKMYLIEIYIACSKKCYWNTFITH